MICRAQNYIDAHDFRDSKSNHGPKDKRIESNKKFEHKRQEDKTHENKTQSSNSSFKSQDKGESHVKQTEFNKKPLTCFNCRKHGHKSIDCFFKKKNDHKRPIKSQPFEIGRAHV